MTRRDLLLWLQFPALFAVWGLLIVAKQFGNPEIWWWQWWVQFVLFLGALELYHWWRT